MGGPHLDFEMWETMNLNDAGCGPRPMDSKTGAPCLDFETWDVRCWHAKGACSLPAMRMFSLSDLQLLSQAGVVDARGSLWRLRT